MSALAFVALIVPSLFSLLLRVNVVSSYSSLEHTALEAADRCDWTGSGGGGQGVRPVYLRCSRGSVSWRYPRGAVRIVLSPPVPAGWPVVGFRACTKASGPVRVYLESDGKLRPVYSPRDGKHVASHRCFYAKKQPPAFYIEAEEPSLSDSGGGSVQIAKLQYDLELQYGNERRRQSSRKFNQNFAVEKSRNKDEEDEDCRPCTMEELAKAYCQSDLVARGTVSAVQRQDFEAAELLVGITRTLRRIEDNEGTNDVDVRDDPRKTKNIRVRVPIACDARHGQGEFVIMAKRRLGDLVLVCAPRLETWARAVRELESAPCVLRS